MLYQTESQKKRGYRR